MAGAVLVVSRQIAEAVSPQCRQSYFHRSKLPLAVPVAVPNQRVITSVGKRMTLCQRDGILLVLGAVRDYLKTGYWFAKINAVIADHQS